MDLEKAYDGVHGNVMWRVVNMYGVNGMLLNAIRSFYAKSEACGRVCRKESEWFRVEVGLRQACVMPPWVFNLFMDGVVREIRKTTGEIGVRLIGDRSRHGWIVEWLMFADDTVLLGDDEKKLQRLVNEFGRVCKKRKLTVNVGKSKVMKVSKNGDQNELNISLHGRKME